MMKKIVALALVAVMLTMTLVSCGTKLSGEYALELAGTGFTFEFKGSKVTITGTLLGMEITSVEGKYAIKKDEITITLENGDDKTKQFDGTFSFEKGDGYIKIGEFKLNEQD